MAREVVVQTWCDPCLASDVHEPAVPPKQPTQFILGTKAWELDTCERHYKELIAPLVEALHEFGIKVDPKQTVDPRSTSDPHTCAECGRTLKNNGSFNAHIRQTHGYSGIKAYRAKWEGAEVPAPEAATCEHCGKTYSHALGNNRPAQALGVHLAMKHGIRSPLRSRS